MGKEVDPVIDPKEMAARLRRCIDGDCDESCPYATVEHDCSAVLMADAAETLEAATAEE